MLISVLSGASYTLEYMNNLKKELTGEKQVKEYADEIVRSISNEHLMTKDNKKLERAINGTNASLERESHQSKRAIRHLYASLVTAYPEIHEKYKFINPC